MKRLVCDGTDTFFLCTSGLYMLRTRSAQGYKVHNTDQLYFHCNELNRTVEERRPQIISHITPLLLIQLHIWPPHEPMVS